MPSGGDPIYLDGEEWQAYFRTFKKSAFRMEVHQTYTMPGEQDSLAAFLRGEPIPENFSEDWHELIRSHRAAGRTMTRAHLVREPLTPYSQYLFEWCIPGNVAAGENYQMFRESAGVPLQDFWLFDETTVVHLNYREDGTQINRELIQDPDLPAYLAWRDAALMEAVPFSAYRT